MVMKLHEYQAKDIFTEAGTPMPESRLVSLVEEIMEAVEEIGYPAVIEAQVRVNGRGKTGGIKITTDEDEARQAVEDILGMGLRGYTVNRMLVEAGVDFGNELYVSVTMNRSGGESVAMVLTEGGINIEEVAEENPDAIAREHIDPAFDLHPCRARRVIFGAGIPRDVAFDMTSLLAVLYGLYEPNGASNIEINPVMIASDHNIVAADAVTNIDDDTLFRHDDLATMKEGAYENDLEAKVGEYGFDYVRLSGNIGITGNGIGLVMTTLDLVGYFGGEPTNSLDIGGGAKTERVTNTLDIVFSDENVDSTVFNIFGGITRGDEVARGIDEALESLDEIPKPVVVHLADMDAEGGMEILNTGLVQVEGTLENAVQRAVENAQEVSQ